MVVLVLTACPEGLRGHLTRWLLEVSAGVFVGHVTARVRDLLWTRVVELARDGRALMVYSQRNEQRLAFKVHGHHWTPTDYEGVLLMLRPFEEGRRKAEGPAGWSRAGRRKRFGQRMRAEQSSTSTDGPSGVKENRQDH